MSHASAAAANDGLPPLPLKQKLPWISVVVSVVFLVTALTANLFEKQLAVATIALGLSVAWALFPRFLSRVEPASRDPRAGAMIRMSDYAQVFHRIDLNADFRADGEKESEQERRDAQKKGDNPDELDSGLEILDPNVPI